MQGCKTHEPNTALAQQYRRTIKRFHSTVKEKHKLWHIALPCHIRWKKWDYHNCRPKSFLKTKFSYTALKHSQKIRNSPAIASMQWKTPNSRAPGRNPRYQIQFFQLMVLWWKVVGPQGAVLMCGTSLFTHTHTQTHLFTLHSPLSIALSVQTEGWQPGR